jgi:hypothetical protein
VNGCTKALVITVSIAVAVEQTIQMNLGIIPTDVAVDCKFFFVKICSALFWSFFWHSCI